MMGLNLFALFALLLFSYCLFFFFFFFLSTADYELL